MPKHAPELVIDSPYVRATVGAGGSGGSSGGGGTPPVGDYAPTPHALESAHHTGLLNWGSVNKAGSSLSDLATRPHSALTGITPDQHHPQVHAIVGADHTAAGLTVGHTIRATGATTFAWQQLQHDDLGGITANQHHNQQHDIVGSDHTATAPAFSIVGTPTLNTLGWLTATHDPGATERLLKTSSNGSFQFDTTLFAVNAATDLVTIDTNLLYADAPNNWIGINRTPSGAALDIVANATGDITQRIKQKAGQTSRLWRVEDSAGQELIVMDSVGNLQSGNPGYVSGLTGWQISHIGNAEFNDIWARGELHASVFVKDEIHASGGTLLVTTAGKLFNDSNIDAGTTDSDEFEVESSAAAFPGPGRLPLTIEETSVTFLGTTLFTQGVGNTIEIEDPPSGPAFYFSPGEILRVKTEIDQDNVVAGLRLSDLWLEVMSATQNTGYATYFVTKRSGTDSTIPKGTAIVSYKQRGEGLIMLTSDLQYAPYIDVFTTGNSPWAGEITPRVRMGQLMGVGVDGVSGDPQWGIIMGSDLSDNNSGYIIASDQQFSLYKVPIRVNNGVSDTGLWEPNGNLKIGKNIGDPATTGFQVITTSEVASEEGMVIIGNVATGNFLRWSQASGILTVSGNLLVEIPDTDVTKIYVDDQDEWYAGQGTAYTNTQRDVAKDYGDFRRVVKVTGSWDSPAANIIRWGYSVAVQVHFAKGATARTITAGQTTTLSARTYLFIDLAVASGNFTMIPSTTAVHNNPNYVLIAVCDPGSPAASVTVVGGSTYISGGNIFTQSILAGNIATGAIITGHMTANTIDGDRIAFNTLLGNKIEAGTITTDLMTANTINGDRILFNSLHGSKITADTITATTLSSVSSNTGNLTVNNALTVGTSGYIHSSGKSAYGSATAGFFLGYNSGYKFDLGNSTNYLRWDGDELLIKTATALVLRADSSGHILEVRDFGGGSQGFVSWTTGGVFTVPSLTTASVTTTAEVLTPLLTLTWATLATKEVIAFEFSSNRRAITYESSTGMLSYSNDLSVGTLFSQALRVNGPVFHFGQASPPAGNANGETGDVRWSWDGTNAYLHICIASGHWRRAQLINY